MIKLKEGKGETLTVIQCPNCGSSTRHNSYLEPQPDQFTLLHTSPTGRIRAWICENCGEYFYTQIRI